MRVSSVKRVRVRTMTAMTVGGPPLGQSALSRDGACRRGPIARSAATCCRRRSRSRPGETRRGSLRPDVFFNLADVLFAQPIGKEDVTNLDREPGLLRILPLGKRVGVVTKLPGR